MPFIACISHAGFGDFILFRGGLENVITEGRFDDSSAPTAERIRATGAVEVRDQ